jgi:hypothetical protein
MAHMMIVSHFPGRIGLCAILMLAAFAPTRAVAEDRPMRVTTDTLEYCVQLHDRIEEIERVAPAPSPVPSPELTSLAAEGQTLCEQGQLRAGILRLRRALMLLMHPQSDPLLPVEGADH